MITDKLMENIKFKMVSMLYTMQFIITILGLFKNL